MVSSVAPSILFIFRWIGFINVPESHTEVIAMSNVMSIAPFFPQGEIEEQSFCKWKAEGWMEVRRNSLGIEYWKLGPMSPRLYSWQPIHGDRGPSFTKRPHPHPRFGRVISPLTHGPLRSLPLAISNSLSLLSPNNRVSLPIIPHRIHKPFNPTRVTAQHISADVELQDLASESSRQYSKRGAVHERHQAIPVAMTELGLSEDQLCNLKARVNRRFLVGYDCSKPMEVKPVSLFIHDPCKPAEATPLSEPERQLLVPYSTKTYAFCGLHGSFFPIHRRHLLLLTMVQGAAFLVLIEV